jgi:hypothetical protein
MVPATGTNQQLLHAGFRRALPAPAMLDLIVARIGQIMDQHGDRVPEPFAALRI